MTSESEAHFTGPTKLLAHLTASDSLSRLVAMLDAQGIQTIGEIIRSLLAEHGICYRIPSFDGELYQVCIDEAVRRDYPIEDPSLKKYLHHSVKYVSTACTTRPDRPSQIWLALYTTFNYYFDDSLSRFPEAIPDLYLFNDRFIKAQRQGSPALDALADIIRQAPDMFPPVLSNLVITSALNFVTGVLLEHETASMQMSSAAQQYPTYQRQLCGFTDAYAFMVFPRTIPLTAYIQAFPELKQFINDVNDVLSFYKEELEGEHTNQISLLAARNKESKLDTLRRVAGSVRIQFDTILSILQGCPEACDAFRAFVGGYFDFHFAVERYRLAELNL